MTDEELTASEPEFESSDPEPAPDPELTPEPEHTSEPEPAPEPEEPATPVEVITIEDLLDRLTGTSQENEETEESLQEDEEETGDFLDELPDAVVDDGPIEVIGMDIALKRLETIQQTVDHPAMTTPFEDYTVTEALLLLLFLFAFVSACVKMLKGGFAWLR